MGIIYRGTDLGSIVNRGDHECPYEMAYDWEYYVGADQDVWAKAGRSISIWSVPPGCSY